MSASIIDGKKIAADIKEELKVRVADLKKAGKAPGLVVIQVGEDPASSVYVGKKHQMCEELGIYSEVIKLPESITEDELIGRIEELNRDERFHGILVQLPLPAHIDTDAVIESISYEKDVDGFTTQNTGRLMCGMDCTLACTPKGIIELIKSTGIDICGKDAVVIGRSNIVGKPVAMALLKESATVTMCHSKTRDLAGIASKADILVVSIGKPDAIDGSYVKEGAVVIDVGISRVDGKLKGDVEFESASEKAGYITPVPGGVGPMTIIMLMKNTIEACERFS